MQNLPECYYSSKSTCYNPNGLHYYQKWMFGLRRVYMTLKWRLDSSQTVCPTRSHPRSSHTVSALYHLPSLFTYAWYPLASPDYSLHPCILFWWTRSESVWLTLGTTHWWCLVKLRKWLVMLDACAPSQSSYFWARIKVQSLRRHGWGYILCGSLLQTDMPLIR